MTSSLISGERRWGSARRGGMTVLGKVAVPKPINLPSQRLENHGLDPNVEIVPKGTLSWGSRPSSSGSNAWGTSALSPSTDGGGSSPNHLAGRPSSDGGTRPSTAGSDKAQDSNVVAWGSNSRPSSASGVLGSSNSSLTSLRPRSADTRPGSSHLSRFAEPSADGPGSWAATAASDRMGSSAPANEGFSLSSGDFPTLGAEKDESRRNVDPQDGSPERPGSSSGGVKSMADSTRFAHNDDASRNASAKGTSWREDGPLFVEDGPRPSMGRWHGEPHMYQNPNMGPPHFDSWRGAPPVNPSGGVWYRGPPGPPPYGGPVPPGGFPMEPFPYYGPQVQAPGLANSQPIPPGPGHPGRHPKNGDMYRPHVPESFMRPGMHMRPGFYPGPVHYDGYLRPQMGFCNPSERDYSHMGMAAGPPIYNRPVNHHAHDLSSSHPRSREGRGPDQVDGGHLPDPRGNFKVLMKPNDVWNRNDEDRWSHRVTTGGPNREKGILSNASLQENAWGDEYPPDENNHYGESAAAEVKSHSFEKGSSKPDYHKFSGSVSVIEEPDLGPADIVSTPRDHSLIQKIEGLNAKARASVGRSDAFHRDEPNDRVQVFTVKDHQPANEANSGVVLERHFPTGVLIPVSRDMDVVGVERSQETITSVNHRRAGRGVQSRGNLHGKGRFNGQESDGWGKKSEPRSVSPATYGSDGGSQVEEQKAPVQSVEATMTNVERTDDGESAVAGFDPSDIQRAKMREIAKQRAIQLQREEEERIREQKAKALAKLEELNRRSANLRTEAPSQKDTVSSHCAVPHKQDDSRDQPEPSEGAKVNGASKSSSDNTVALHEGNAGKTVDSGVMSMHMGAETKRNVYPDSVLSQSQLPAANANSDDAAGTRTVPQVHEVSKQKRTAYKQRQNVPLEKKLSQNPTNAGKTDSLKDHEGANVMQEVSATKSQVALGAGKELSESPVVSDSPLPQKRRNNKSGKNKQKMEESSRAVTSMVSLPNDSNFVQGVAEVEEHSGVHVNSASVQVSADPKVANLSSENRSPLAHEDAQGRVNNAWKSQQSRKARNSQGNRLSEKNQSNDAVVWAPVRSHNKVEVSDQTTEKVAEPLACSGAGDNVLNNSPKVKRAEMERYVPKPVAKELAQQGSLVSPSQLADQAANDGASGREKGSQGSEFVGKSGLVVESKHVDGKSRHGKAQGSWRQRVFPESNNAQALRNNSTAAISSKNTLLSGESQQTVGSSKTGRELPNQHDELSAGGPQPQTVVADGWNSVDGCGPNSSASVAGTKDPVSVGRGKRHPFIKGQKGNGVDHNFDRKDSTAGLPDAQSPPETNQAETTISSTDYQAVGDRSHWQPKSQGYAAHNRQGNRFRSGQNHTAEERKGFRRDIGPGSSLHSQSQHDPSVAGDSKQASGDRALGEVMSAAVYQESKREKRGAPVKGRPLSPGLEPAVEVEHDAHVGGADGRNDHRPASGFRKNANYSSRFNRHEPRGDWSTAAQENKQQHYSSGNREWQRQNSHYEYQPVGPCTSNNEAGPHPESQPGGPRYRERGHNYSRRGRGHYVRQSGHE